MMILLIGGSGSGKSALAEKITAAGPAKQKYYLATMEVFGEEGRARAARHRAQRARYGFETLELPMDIGAAPIPQGCAALLEDLPNLLANEMFSGGDPNRILPGILSLNARCERLVIVTGNVFSDGIVYEETTMDYMRRLADLNRALTERADAAAEIVYSIPILLKGALPCD